jgi:hypothetical protein
MRKSVLAVAAVAAMGTMGSANAAYWHITGANYNNGSNVNIGPVGGLTMNGQAYDSSGLGGSSSTFTSNAATTTVLGAGALNITLANDTLTYFGYDQPGSLGSFGVAFKATSAINFLFAGGPAASQGTQGVLANQATISGASLAGGGFTADFAVAANTTLVVLFGGLNVGSGFSMNISRTAGAANFSIDYLNFDGSNYVSLAGASGATASGLNIATYSIPVPAPALLAGAGLVGAAALRRRMAKKA